MTPHTPVAPSPPPAAAPVEITETQAFTQAWVLFTVLLLVVVGVLWALQAHYG